jgi:hypothetical protein
LVAHLQKNGTLLDLEERLVSPRLPLRSALLSGIYPLAPRTFTYLLNMQDNGQPVQGFVQAQARSGRPELDVVALAPTLGHSDTADLLWQRLLAELCRQAGKMGYYRIYARQETEQAGLGVFKNTGFTPYTEEYLYRLFPSAPFETAHHPLKLRRQTNADGWSIQRLYAAVTPKAVQMAEGLAQGQWEINNYPIGQQGYERGYVWESQGEISAVVYLRTGKQGFLFRILVHPHATAQTTNLVLAGLSLLKNPTNKPFYFSLRSYQHDLRHHLLDCGFTPMASQVVLVKHTTVRARDFLSRLISAFDATTETPQPATPTVMQSKTEPKNGQNPTTGPLHI